MCTSSSGVGERRFLVAALLTQRGWFGSSCMHACFWWSVDSCTLVNTRDYLGIQSAVRAFLCLEILRQNTTFFLYCLFSYLVLSRGNYNTHAALSHPLSILPA